jgi:hypothetical protein
LNRRQSPACIAIPFIEQKIIAMNKQTEQLKRRLYNKIESIQDAEYLASLDAVITWETTSEPATNKRFTFARWWREFIGRNRRNTFTHQGQAAFR